MRPPFKTLALALLLGGSRLALAQGFVNLNFESANVSGYPVIRHRTPYQRLMPFQDGQLT